jgi:hypothetical protein
VFARDFFCKAIGEPPLFAIGPSSDRPDCLVEQAVDARLDDALKEAKALWLERFRTVTLAEFADDFDRRMPGDQCNSHAEPSAPA